MCIRDSLRSLRTGYQALDDFAVENKLSELQASMRQEVQGLHKVRAELQSVRGLDVAARIAARTRTSPEAAPPAAVSPPPEARLATVGVGAKVAPTAVEAVQRGLVREPKPIDAGLATEQMKSGADYVIATLQESEVAAHLRKTGLPADWRTDDVGTPGS
eukprot:TRINITY_DN21094_c0_g1_i1.p1 TRINITY_DN21094_c0_g1~~TRINITY_DN21094_c0_g1_i1.p1  ORF type:complete len:160 (+),score=23.06 TRINITY_DN21094_c0_g1_i1:128-607(+)